MSKLLPFPYNIIVSAVCGLLLIVGIWFAIHSYGNSRYDAGKKETDAEWQAAALKLQQQSSASASTASAAAVTRETQYATQLQHEKDKIDEAVRNGTSPLDAVFPSSVPNGQGGGKPSS